MCFERHNLHTVPRLPWGASNVPWRKQPHINKIIDNVYTNDSGRTGSIYAKKQSVTCFLPFEVLRLTSFLQENRSIIVDEDFHKSPSIELVVVHLLAQAQTWMTRKMQVWDLSELSYVYRSQTRSRHHACRNLWSEGFRQSELRAPLWPSLVRRF